MSTNKWMYRTLISLMCVLQLTQAASLRCYKGSLDDYQETPLNNPLGILACIDKAIPTVLYTFGYRGKVSGPATTAMLLAYIAKKKSNVILLDWENEAQSGILGIQLGYVVNALPKAMKVGNKLGDALTAFTEAGVNMNDLHLLGHSLGAHVMAFAGKRLRANGYTVGRITGLDPARAFFEGTLAIHIGLDRTCAKFVDIIHTDPGNYGTSTSSGTVDIWPNYNGSRGIQPGCPVGDFAMFSSEDLCSHDRAWRFYAEALGSPTSFPAAGASNVNEWIATDGETNQTVYMGDLTSIVAKGNFYMRTNSEAPFGMHAAGLKPAAAGSENSEDSNSTRSK